MSEQENICPVCGGVKRVQYTISFEEGVPREMSINKHELPETAWRICPGHPEPTSEHDGRLGNECDVEYTDVHYPDGTGIDIRGKYATGNGEDSVILRAEQALSLLAWLEQEKPELERLAKEQEGE